MATTYITASSFTDTIVKKLVTATEQYITDAENEYLAILDRYDVTAPDAGDQTYYANQFMICYASWKACSENIGLYENFSQDGEGIDKYMVKAQDYYVKVHGDDGKKSGQASKGYLDKLLEEINEDTTNNVVYVQNMGL